MKPAVKLLLVVFAVTMPYMAFVMYSASRYPSGHWPTWMLDTLLVWFTVNFLIVLGAAKKLRRDVSNRQESGAVPANSNFGSKSAVPQAAVLVLCWTGVFVYGLVQVFEHKVTLQRAIPAGLFLLFFIGLFGRGLYKTLSAKA